MGVALTDLWIPILVSAVVVFITSSIIWMVLPIHKNDYSKLPEEEKMLQSIREQKLPGGMYMFPFCDHKNMKSPENIEKLKAGPWGCITVMEKPVNMGASLSMWIVNILLLTTGVAYLASTAYMKGTGYMKIFTFVAIAAFVAHGGGILTDSIWKGRPWKALPASLFDAIVYALLTAGIFGWLWPKLSITLP